MFVRARDFKIYKKSQKRFQAFKKVNVIVVGLVTYYQKADRIKPPRYAHKAEIKNVN